MATTFVTTPGAPDANSYASVEAADVVMENYGNELWAALAQEDKEKFLRRATGALDRRYGEQWMGRRDTAVQALDWPRRGVVQDGFEVPVTQLPRRLVEATIFAADLIRGGFTFDTTITKEEMLRSRTDTIGPLTKRRVYAGSGSGGAPIVNRSSLIDNLVSPLLGFSGSSIPLVRC